ncbi:hypothetical protein [Ramlibacter albus]|uniref:Uncharacterized protein n=1 Tax=Ramlibacter albus TaxID=2079448 RepID=A0A923M803_9BURK|nr:hypothetical protein [Ramlibacter albus]MBC5764578.1 hypothetical protein [Ramlibacter albus]
MAERLGMVIAHSEGGFALLLLGFPGMIPVFFGAFTNEYIAWAVAAVGNALWYWFWFEAAVWVRSRGDAEADRK